MTGQIGVKFICGKCGNQLNLHTKKEPDHLKIRDAGFHWDQIIVPIDPCQFCYAEGQKPKELLKELLGKMND